MAVIQKTLFAKNLDKFAVLVNDTQPDSKYFKITELPNTFTGGKNAFLIAGSEQLVPDTRIQIELKDASGNIIYHEPGEGLISASVNGESFVTEYFEGVSKVVAVYVYPDTAYGPCTLTILGELSEYEDGNGITTPVPLDWENKYNVKWQKQIDVNPSLANTTKIRFYRRPSVSITELLEPIYRIESGSKVNSGVSQSFADIKISNLETFAGDVKRVKVFRTSLGDISDFSLIQDILVESKELLSTFGLSGSVIGNTGTLTSETLKSFWNTGSLNVTLSNNKIESGIKMNGTGKLTYTSSLDIKSLNTYEINLDAFYSASTKSDLGIYLSYVSQSTTFTSSIATLSGLTPTVNLLDTTIPFRVDRDYPSASLYFSQSQGEWHIGNISLRLSQDTAFSPDEISFITTMPTVIGNEDFNFKFEFYDVNNNYVPVAVTQSATFNGGTIVGAVDVDFIISSSFVSASNLINAVSSSISGTMTVYSSSASSSISSLSSSVSSSNSFILSSSLSKVQQLANGQYSGSFIGDTVIYSPTIGGQQGYISDLFKVGTAPSIYLDARQNPRKIFIGGVSDSGSYNNSNTNVYMDSTGKFSLGNKLKFDGTTLTVTGQINIEAGGNAASTTDVSTAQTNAQSFATTAANNAVTSGSAFASAVDAKVFTDSSGKLTKTPSLTSSGLFLGSTFLGYYNGSAWKTYMSNTGNFFLSGGGSNGLSWDGTTLSITGNITVSGGNAATTTQVSTAQTTADNAATAASNAQTTANGKISAGGAAADVNSNTTTISGGKIRTGIIESTGYSYSSGDFSTTGTQINLDNGLIRSKNFSIDSSGNAFFKGNISGASGTFTGNVQIGTGDGRVLISDRGFQNVKEDEDTDNLTHIGPEGIQIKGTHDSGREFANSYIDLRVTSGISKITAVSYVPTETVLSVQGFPQSNVAASRVYNGGFEAQNFATSQNGVSYDGTGNFGYAIRSIGSFYCSSTGEFVGDVTANTSDRRLKTKIVNIDSPLEKISKINGVYFNWNNKAKELTGKDTNQREVGFIAQDVQSVLPEIIKPAPFDRINSNGGSKSGENYLTIQYEKIVPLLVECIKELKSEIEELKKNK